MMRLRLRCPICKKPIVVRSLSEHLIGSHGWVPQGTWTKT